MEKAGSGTQMIIDECISAGLPKPDFIQKEGFFIIKLWRNWLNEENLKTLGLNKRQTAALEYLNTNLKKTNAEYQTEFNVSKRTATRDLNELLYTGTVIKTGTRGQGTYYELRANSNK